MDSQSALETFSQQYVLPTFRERFLHEAQKRPEKLHSRVCHNIEEVLPASLAGGRCSLQAETPCLVLDGTRGFRPSTWREVRRKIGLGDGLLVVGNNGAGFYAETEAAKGAPSVVYGA